MAVLQAGHSGPGVNLCTSLTGNVDSTNTADRGGARRSAMVQITSVVGATPSVTVNILGSMDNVNFFNVGYGTTAAPGTEVITALTITTATTQQLLLWPEEPWRYLKINMSANTNVTLTVDFFA